MKLRPWMVDFAVWMGLAATFILTISAVSFAMRPPSYEELQARAEQQFLQQCAGWPETRALHRDMQHNVCQCLVTRQQYTFGGIDKGDFNTCRNRVAARMTRHADLDRAFEANYANLCGKLEGSYGGIASNGQSPFCLCLKSEVASVPAVKASYAFGTGEGRSEDRDNRIRACFSSMNLGEGWKVTESGKASMRMPPYMPYNDLVLRCSPEGLVFEVIAGASRVDSDLVFSDEVGTLLNDPSSPGAVAAPMSYGLVEKLSLRQNAQLWAVGVGYNITLSGFSQAAAAVVKQCPEQVPDKPQVASLDHNYPDPWEMVDAGLAFTRRSVGPWLGTLACEGTPYFAIQGDFVQNVIDKFAKPSGEHLADDVPFTVSGDNGILMQKNTFCDWGYDEGASDSCYFILEKPDLDRIFASSFVAFQIAGMDFDPVAFGSSPGIQAIRNACYRGVN